MKTFCIQRPKDETLLPLWEEYINWLNTFTKIFKARGKNTIGYYGLRDGFPHWFLGSDNFGENAEITLQEWKDNLN